MATTRRRKSTRAKKEEVEVSVEEQVVEQEQPLKEEPSESKQEPSPEVAPEKPVSKPKAPKSKKIQEGSLVLHGSTKLKVLKIVDQHAKVSLESNSDIVYKLKLKNLKLV